MGNVKIEGGDRLANDITKTELEYGFRTNIQRILKDCKAIRIAVI